MRVEQAEELKTVPSFRIDLWLSNVSLRLNISPERHYAKQDEMQDNNCLQHDRAKLHEVW